MNAPLRQADRVGRLTTVLGPDVLVLLRLAATEQLNELFEARIEALSADPDLDFDALIGTHATVEIETREGPRPFDGIVTSARWAGVGENGHRYDLILRPWFWIASRRRNQRIFHNKTVVEILSELLAPYQGLGNPALENRLSRDYPVLEYTVQYRESDLDFARRQMERAGISFHFTHRAGNHTLVLTDDVGGHGGIGARPFKPYDGHHQPEGEHFWEWAPERNLTTGAIRLTDWNFKTPLAAMEVDRMGDAVHAQGQVESFDYPGDYLDQGQGKGVVALRTSQERGQDRRIRAAGDCVSLGAGLTVTLSGDPVPGTGEAYVCLTARHDFVSEAYGTGGGASNGYAYSGAFTLMPVSAPLAPPRRTLVPVVNGPQTAVVVGEGEIDCDDYGRILVRFAWDLAGAYSMRCRVSQNWAGNGWGGMVIPRIGMEVVVEFLEGDPDKPLVTGCVYNGVNAAPYDLPGNKTCSTFRTDTHEGEGYNELRFEDQSGQEEILTHAQRDHNAVVRRDALRSVQANDYHDIGGTQFTSITGHYVTEAKGTVELASGRGTVISAGAFGMSGRDFFHIPTCEEPEFSQAKISMASMRSAMQTGGVTIRAQTMLHEQAGLSKTSIIGAAFQELVGLDKTTHVGKSIRMTTGGTIHMAAADNIAVEAGERIDIVCGKSSIQLNADGRIIITGVHVRTVADDIDEN